MKSSQAEKFGAPIEALNIPVVYLDFETPEQYPRDLAILGQIFGNDARAQETYPTLPGRSRRNQSKGARGSRKAERACAAIL
jgi:hypothetical protein